MNLFKKVCTLLLLFTIGTVSAQQIITDRPDQNDASSIVPLKSFQIEAGVLFQRSGGIQANTYPSILWRYGLSKTFELRLLTEYETNKRLNTSQQNNGISDLQIGTKIQLFKKEDVNTEIAFLSHLIIPSAKDGITNGNLGTINKLAISHSISESVGIGYNAGYANYGRGSGNLLYSLSLGFSLSEKWNFYLESYGEFVAFDNHFSSFDTGFMYLANNNLQLDISYGTGLNYEMNYFSTGVSWVIPYKKK
ncbi:MAG: transporter [Flavobacteriaceae bacterium]